MPPTDKEIPLGPLTSLQPFNRLVIPGPEGPSPFLTSQLLFWTPPGPSLPPTPGTEPGTPVLSLDWMTSPSCQEPGRSSPTKDMVAATPETHLPSFCQDTKGCPSDRKIHTRVVVEASFPKHGEMQTTLGFGVCSPMVDQELKWEESGATDKTDSRKKSRRPVQSRSLMLETSAPPTLSCIQIN